MVRLTPRSEYGRRRANPRQAGWATSKSVGSRCAAKPIGERWRPRGGDPDHGNAVRPLPPMFPDPAVRALVDGPAGAIWRARYAPGWQHRQRATAKLAEAAANQNPIMNGVMRLSTTSPMADDRNLAARRTLARQPLGILFAGLACIAGTWDKDDHGQRRRAPESATRQGTRLRGSAFAPKYQNLR
jgi:hypothetical protein